MPPPPPNLSSSVSQAILQLCQYEGLGHNQLSREESESESLYCPSRSLHGNLSYGVHDR